VPYPFPERDLTKKSGRLDKKADDLLHKGDAIAKTNPAESRRILRECRKYRKLADEAERQGK